LTEYSVVRRQYLLSALIALALAPVTVAQASGPTPSVSVAQPKVEVGVPVLQGHSYKEFNGYGQVWTILQDRRGVMFFGISGSELLEYDGVTWRKIHTPGSTVRSLAMDDSGKIWVGANSDFGYLEPDNVGTLHYVSLLENIPEKERNFTDVWQTLVTPQGIFFRSYQLLFRWDGKSMHVWSPAANARFQALSSVRGHIYTSQTGIGLQEIIGDELRSLPGGDAYKTSIKLFLNPYDETHIVVSAREGLLTLYDGQKSTPFPTQADDYLKQHKLYTSTLLNDGSLCLTTLTGGAVIVGHDGKLRQVIDEADGLLDPGALSAYVDRDGALWVGTTNGVTRVEIASPISLFSRIDVLDALRFKGQIYVAQGGGFAPVQKLVFDAHTNRPSLVPYGGAAQRKAST
jgi:ligand-binding sensor domain-containing protein